MKGLFAFYVESKELEKEKALPLLWQERNLHFKHNVINKRLIDMTIADEEYNIITLKFENGVEMTVEVMDARKSDLNATVQEKMLDL
jgi:hypothetical protein